MKAHTTILIALPAAAFLALALPSCEKKPKGPAEKIGEAIDDALDQRPAEKIQDAVEDAAEAVKDAVN